MEHLEAMQLIMARSTSSAREAAKTIRRLSNQAPNAQAAIERTIATALGDLSAEFSAGEREALASLLGGSEDEATPTRSHELRIRVTANEKEIVQAAANAAGQTISDYVRECVGIN